MWSSIHIPYTIENVAQTDGVAWKQMCENNVKTMCKQYENNVQTIWSRCDKPKEGLISALLAKSQQPTIYSRNGVHGTFDLPYAQGCGLS